MSVSVCVWLAAGQLLANGPTATYSDDVNIHSRIVRPYTIDYNYVS